MSVIVKGMEEPERCDLCPFFRTYRYSPNIWCNGQNKVLLRVDDPMEVSGLEVEVPNWCPIRPLPDVHGELIDRDFLLSAKWDWCDAEAAIKDAVVIVEAEE